MANYLKVTVYTTILTLYRAGHSARWIARELGCSREAVRRCIWRYRQEETAKVAAGSAGVAAGSAPPNEARVTAGSAGVTAGSAPPNEARVAAGSVVVGPGGSGEPGAASYTQPALVDPQEREEGRRPAGRLSSLSLAAAPPVGAGAAPPAAACALPPLLTVPAAVLPGAGAASQSQCLPFQGAIEEGLKCGLTAQRIWQDLVAEQGFAGSYSAVKRFVRRRRPGLPAPFRRLECGPGAECQVDFGRGAWVVEPPGTRRRPHRFRVVLSYSRKAYSEVVWHHNTETFIRVLENAFRAFGGVPERTVLDNLKAAVPQADWYDPEVHPKVASFAAHYGTVLWPTRPGVPRHKGKIERQVDDAQENALRGRCFPSLTAQNAALQQWERQVADTRIHGTTREQVQAAFLRERPVLRPLPPTVFPDLAEGPRMGHLDGYVEVAKSYYSAPPEFVQARVWGRWDRQVVHLYADAGRREIRCHARVEPGRFSTHPRDLPAYQVAAVERGEHYLLDQLACLGPEVAGWGRALLQQQGVTGLRVLVGLRALTRHYSASHLNRACQEARALGLWRLREVRALARHLPPAPTVSLLQHHPLIRELREYQALVPDAFAVPESLTPNPEDPPHADP